MPAHASNAAAAGSPGRSFAEVTLGDLRIGVPLDCVAQVLARPAAIAPLPRSRPACEGVFRLGRQFVPLVDLRRWIAPDAAAPVAPLVMVLRSADRILGLAIDAVHGVHTLATAQIAQVHHEAAPDTLFESMAEIAPSGCLMALLEPQRLMAQLQVWTADCTVPDGAADGGPAPPRHGAAVTAPYAIFCVGSTLFGIAAHHVCAALARPTLQHPFGNHDQWSAMLRWREHNVALLHAACLSASAGRDQAPPFALVLRHGARHLALPVDQVVAVRTLEVHALHAVPELGLAGNELLEAIVPHDRAGTILLLDAKRLTDRYALDGLGGGAPVERHATRPRTVVAHIVFGTGMRWALPITAMLAIIAVPAQWGPIGANDQGICGTIAWHGSSLPVLDLRLPERGTVPPPAPRLIVVDWHGRRAALLVRSVIELIPVNAGYHTRFRLMARTDVEMITVDDGSGHKSVRIMNLDRLPFFRNAS